MDTSSSIRHRLDVEIPPGKFVEITLIGESTWKLWHQWVLHVDFSMSFRHQTDSLFPFYHFLTFSPTGTPRLIHVDSTWILRRYVENQISTNFRVISAYFFDVISMVEKPTWFPRTFFDVISMFEKSTLFPRTFFDVNSMVEKSTLFSRAFISAISIVETCTLFLLTFFDVISMGKDLALFLVSCRLVKTFEKVFPVFVTLNSWLLEDCSL